MAHPSSAPRALVFGLLLATVLSGFASLTPSVRADHDNLPWRHYGAASDVPGFDSAEATVFADRAGAFYVFYTITSTTGSLSNLNVSKFETRGFANVPVKIFDRQVNRAQGSIFSGIAPSVAMDESGALYVAYSEFRSGFGAEVYVSKSVDGGATWLNETRANAEGASGMDVSPSIAVARNGNVFVAWIQAWGPVQNVSASVSMNGGNSFVNAQNITGVPFNAGTTAASITTDSENRVYVVYDDYDYATNRFNVNLTWSDDGVSWSRPRTLSGPNSNVFLPAIRADRGDRLHLAWIDTLGLTSQVWYARSGDRGATWTPPVTVSQNTAEASVGSRTSIGISGGTLMVAWTATQSGVSGLAFAVSADSGDRWSGERFFAVPGISTYNAVVDADENGTFYAAPTQAVGSPTAVFLEYWYGPPTAPTITSIGRGTGRIEVRWIGSPEPNVVGYRVWRSGDGLSYTTVGSVGPASANHTDMGLANGTYWYTVQAVNDQGIASHLSTPVRATVGQTPEEQIADLKAEIAALQAQLAKLNNSSSQEAAALQARIDELQSRLDALQTNQATESTAVVNSGLLIAIVVLVAALMLMQSRKPKPEPPPTVLVPHRRGAESEVLQSEEVAPEESANLPLPGFEDDL
jgi:hypothetical protein